MLSSKRSRRQFTVEQKVATLKRHLADKVPVSDLCNEEGLQPSVFYEWQRQLFENLAGAFTTPASEGTSKREKELMTKTTELEAKLARKDHVVAAATKQLVAAKKRAWGPLTGRWVPHDIRDTIVDFVRVWSDKTEIAADRFVAWIGIARGKFFAWKKRYGKANEHNGRVPRDHWLLDDEKRSIIAFHARFPHESYRRLTEMMAAQGIVTTSSSSVYRVLSAEGLLNRRRRVRRERTSDRDR